MFNFKVVYDAYKKCIRNKRNTLNAQNFEANLIENLCDLQMCLENRSYRIGKSICFLTHSPKLREVFAADFRDRVVHHILVEKIEAYYEKKFIHDVYNNRKDKGIHSAAKKAQKFAYRFKDGYFLQLDIKGFFYNLDKNILFKQFFNDIQKSDLRGKKEILWLANKIIYHDSTKNFSFKGDKTKLALLPSHKTLFKISKEKGLPIGNLTSQFFANVYLNKFDHFIKRELRIKGYLRYVDDFVLFSDSKEALKEAKKRIELYLKEHLSLELREDFKLKRTTQGLDFLGYIIRPHYLLVRNRVVKNYKHKKAQFLDYYESKRGKVSLAEINGFLSVQASFAGHTRHADSYNLMKKVGYIDDEKYIRLVGTEWSTYGGLCKR